MTGLFIGLISGTSMDAIDAGLLDLSTPVPQLRASHSEPLPDSLKQRLQALIHGEHPSLSELGQLDTLLGRCFADATNHLLTASGTAARDVQAIGSHGQTVWHQPDGDAPFTLQIADPNIIAEGTGITTVADFRRRDLAVGGQGAPLAPAFHAAVFQSSDEERVVLNLGGMANITRLPTDDSPVIGFDTGPANVLLDIWCLGHQGSAYDADGAWAATGTIHDGLLDALLDEAYFDLPPPKSTGREVFNAHWLQQALDRLPTIPDAKDVQATLVELTAVTVSEALRNHAPTAAHLLVCGGGAHNRYLLARLASHLPGLIVETTAEYGLAPDWVEAAAFAWLAQQTLEGKPGNLPAVTGATRPVVLGAIYKGNGEA